MEPHEVGGHPIARADVRAVLGPRRQHPLEAPVERDGLHVVGFKNEANPLQRSGDLVANRPDDGELRLGRQPAASTDGDLLHAPGDPGVGIDNVAVGVLPKTEAELQAAVLRCRHRAHLLRPRRVARPDVGERLGDLMTELLVGGDDLTDLVLHGSSTFGCRAAVRSDQARASSSMSSTTNSRSRISPSGSPGAGISPKCTARPMVRRDTIASRTAL